jgi:hypothetical protein
MMEEQKVFEMKIITNHNKLYFKLKENAPRRTVSENTGRGRDHMGIGGYGEVSSGYRAIMVYIQLGLSDHGELIREIVNLILEVQKGYGTKYPIIPAAFGKGNEFISYIKYFER